MYNLLETLLGIRLAEALVFSAVFGLAMYLLRLQRRRMVYRFPPGPKGLPLFGVFFDIYDYPAHLAYTTWSKTHGAIFTTNVMGRKTVVLNDVKTIREALLTCSPMVDSRSEWRYCFQRLLKGLSVMPYTKKYVNTRRRTVSILREYGMGKSFLELRIYDETHALISNILRDSNNGLANIAMKNRIRRTPVNVICSMLFNERYDYDDSSMMFILETIEYLLTFLRTACTHDSLPRPLRPLMKHSLRDFHKNVDILCSFLSSKVKYHEETYKDEVQRDFLDAWIKSQKTLQKNAKVADVANNNRTKDDSAETGPNVDEASYAPVVNVLQDVLIAGAHSTGFAMNWLIMLMTLYKDIQDELYQAIMDAVGPERRATMADRAQLPIVEAIIHETLRLSTLVPLVGHACMDTVTLCGYKLPKDAEVTYNNWAVNHNEENFPDSFSFLPKRWIKDDGSFDRDSVSKFFPFGIGKRSCAGETLAKMELFIITVTLFQNLEFFMPDETVGAEFQPELKHIQSFVLEPKPYLVRVKRRSSGTAQENSAANWTQ